MLIYSGVFGTRIMEEIHTFGGVRRRTFTHCRPENGMRETAILSGKFPPYPFRDPITV